ncbi:hypothetical protein AB0O91_37560 [Kitasatospora sp. NPDC089797]|uniref:hypothetical protein n=1 Tax=Kitasatospora sp. NPDC089797 TaxID=3155298 RepID=UPI0034408035
MGAEATGGTDGGPARACPRCERPLVRQFTRSGAYGGTKEWWTCGGCGFLGRPDRRGGPVLHPFRYLTGEDGDCVFCGGEESNRASESFPWDGRWCEWIVCAACGRENVRRADGGPW